MWPVPFTGHEIPSICAGPQSDMSLPSDLSSVDAFLAKLRDGPYIVSDVTVVLLEEINIEG